MTLEEEMTLFNHELGWALGQWAWIEFAMFQVVSTCVTQDQTAGLGKGIFSIENNRSRIAFVDAVMDHSWAGSLHFTEWSGLHKRLTKAAAERNRLAHNILNTIPTLQVGRRIALEPWIYKAPKRKGKVPQHPPDSLCLRDVAAIGLKFYALRCSLTNYAARVSGRPEPQPKDHEQLANHPTLQQIRARIRAGLAPPPRPSKK
jgi:hypothetical protein